MKTVTGKVISAEPISISKAATLLSEFTASNNGASQAVSAYLRRASAAFTELKSIHKEIKSGSVKETKPRSDARKDRNRGEFEEVGRVKGVDDLVENGGEKQKKKKSKRKREEDVVEETVTEELQEEEE